MSKQVEEPTRFAVVTGAGSGIGAAVTRKLAAAGWQVTIVGRTARTLAETAEAVRADLAERGSPAPPPLAVTADVSAPEDVQRLFETVRDTYGRLDLLFNNAGTFGTPGPLADLAFADWQRVVDVNLTGSFLCAQAAFALMADQNPRGGRIINNGSISAHVPRPHAIAYTATKHGVTGLTKALALEGRKHDIACGQIDIGNAATDMTSGMSGGALQADGSVRAEPTMDARHVADLVLYLANLPLSANVPFATVAATTMPYGGRG